MGLLALRYGDREALVNVERNRRFTYRERPTKQARHSPEDGLCYTIFICRGWAE